MMVMAIMTVPLHQKAGIIGVALGFGMDQHLNPRKFAHQFGFNLVHHVMRGL